MASDIRTSALLLASGETLAMRDARKPVRWSISKEIRWEAAHYLPQLPPEHPCARLHGHSYSARIWLSARELDDQFHWVLDFGALRPLRERVQQCWDHQVLNDLPEFAHFPPTAERIAQVLGEWTLDLLRELQVSDRIDLVAVEVSETPTNTAIAYWSAPLVSSATEEGERDGSTQ